MRLSAARPEIWKRSGLRGYRRVERLDDLGSEVMGRGDVEHFAIEKLHVAEYGSAELSSAFDDRIEHRLWRRSATG